ncbi:uncharacterized protein PODANS_2_6660 [Podospora anserina S mat+]|uniref:Podospora anserina S mat+ genomic DNA chromosome 2, supercontig 2 n=1 Tax=Podospora anserina (strain S / ATCC MYA-4624 / DSM 980 / FGSC 10383) TaxID=515849 RepID=B2B643_PODAN|nr:uncharacterized protein PODANS_2_6660 [Podospora anserina S mat+]CAP73268.1 unnamed protein product [Podospora anserina S mat+]CDP25669.1 Putative protein of unknown function [Podospora anserina S mat+]
MAPISLLIMALMPLLALAMPTAIPATASAVDVPGNVLVCTGENYMGECQTVQFNIEYPGECLPIPEPFKNNVGSFKPDRGAICRLFAADRPDCTGSGLSILYYPGQADLLTDNGEYIAGHEATYWRCQTCTGCT